MKNAWGPGVQGKDEVSSTTPATISAAANLAKAAEKAKTDPAAAIAGLEKAANKAATVEAKIAKKAPTSAADDIAATLAKAKAAP